MEKILDDLSRDSDYHVLSFHIEMMMEYPWHTCNWKDGIALCDELTATINSKDFYNDAVMKTSLEKELHKIDLCKNYFLFINDEAYNNPAKREHVDSSYFTPFLNRVYPSLNRFIDDPNDQKYKHIWRNTLLSLKPL